MSFIKRQIDVTITLGEGTFGETVGSTVTLSGYRVRYLGADMGGVTQGTASVEIYGLSLSMLNQLTTIGPVANQVLGKNTIQVAAGDEGSALSNVFVGSIQTAYGQFDSAPDVPLIIEGYGAGVAALKPVNASSYVGAVDAANCMKDFAAEAGFQFENNGISVILSNPYFSGTTLTKIKECAQAAQINYNIGHNVLAIWPRGGYRAGQVPVISSGNGMIGYPSFGSCYVAVRTLFLPDIQVGMRYTIEGSENIKANGTWTAHAITHRLESQTPGGAWFTEIQGVIV